MTGTPAQEEVHPEAASNCWLEWLQPVTDVLIDSNSDTEKVATRKGGIDAGARNIPVPCLPRCSPSQRVT